MHQRHTVKYKQFNNKGEIGDTNYHRNGSHIALLWYDMLCVQASKFKYTHFEFMSCRANFLIPRCHLRWPNTTARSCSSFLLFMFTYCPHLQSVCNGLDVMQSGSWPQTSWHVIMHSWNPYHRIAKARVNGWSSFDCGRELCSGSWCFAYAKRYFVLMNGSLARLFLRSTSIASRIGLLTLESSSLSSKTW